MFKKLEEIHDFLFIFGTVKSYTIWAWHREIIDIPTMFTIENFEERMDNHLEEMIHDVGEQQL